MKSIYRYLSQLHLPAPVRQKHPGRAFLAEGGWQGRDAAGVVQAFSEFAKKRGLAADPTLDDAVSKAKKRAHEQNANRKRNPRSPRPRWMDR